MLASNLSHTVSRPGPYQGIACMPTMQAREIIAGEHALRCERTDAAAFDASYVLAFLLAGTFLVYAVLILVMRNVFVREEREGKLAPHKTAAAAPAPAPANTANNAPAVSRPAPHAVLEIFVPYTGSASAQALCSAHWRTRMV